MAAKLSVSTATARYVSTTEGITAGSINITKATTYATETAKVYNMGGKDWAQSETSSATRTILLLATVPTFSATKYTHLEDYNITKIGVCLKTDGSPDYTSPVIYDSQYGMWLTNVKLESHVACPSKVLTGTAPTSSDPYAYLRLPAKDGGIDLCYIEYRVANIVDITINNSQSPIDLSVTGAATETIAAGTSKTLTLEAGAKLTLALSTDLTYQKKFVAYKVGSTTKGTSTIYNHTVGGGETITVTWQNNPTATLKAPANANLTATLTWGSPTQTNTISASAGSSATIYIPPSKAQLALFCEAINGAEFYTWLRNGSSTAITANNPSNPFSPASGEIYSCTTRTPYTVTIKAPAGLSIAYTFGLDGTQQAAGTVSAGTSKAVKLYRESGGNMTLVLTASPFSLSTFGGWTKDGVVIDPYSNPATIIANEAATYSCLIGQASPPTTSSGRLLYGKYGNLLYADTIKAASSHTIAISADFEVSGHIITCSITKPSEAQETGTADITKTFSRTKTIAFPATGTNSGQLIFADKTAPLPANSTATQRRLIKILFHCDNAVHKYTLTIKLDGTTYFSDTLSGTFSRTIAVS